MNAVSFFRKHAHKKAKYLQLDAGILHDIHTSKLPFTSRNYYAFCDKYLDDDANEALFLDENEKYFREIATDYETFRYFHYVLPLLGPGALFCDIGCGIGNTLVYTQKLGFTAFGYEINRFLSPLHKRLKLDVVFDDIITCNAGRLADADVLYLYRPINDTQLMNRLFTIIHKNCREDVLVFYNYPHSRRLRGFETVELGRHDDMIALLKV